MGDDMREGCLNARNPHTLYIPFLTRTTARFARSSADRTALLHSYLAKFRTPSSESDSRGTSVASNPSMVVLSTLIGAGELCSAHDWAKPQMHQVFSIFTTV